MTDVLALADGGPCVAPGENVRHLAWRMNQCLGRLDLVMIRMGRHQLRGWQSPAGDAYRSVLNIKLAELKRCRDDLEAAAALVTRHVVILSAASGQDGH